MRYLSILLLVGLSLFWGQATWAQGDAPPLRFKSGEITLPENLSLWDNPEANFANQKFEGRYALMLQFHEIPSEELRKSKDGWELLQYFPENTWYAWVDEDLSRAELEARGVRALHAPTLAQKTSFEFRGNTMPDWATPRAGYLQARVVLNANLTPAKLQSLLAELNGFAAGSRVMDLQNVVIPIGQKNALAEKPWVRYAELAGRPTVERNGPGRNSHRAAAVNSLASYGLTGDGVRVGEWDGGSVGPHADFTARLTNKEAAAGGGHATHVGGTVAGAGVIDPDATGMAPEATLFAWTSAGANAEMNAAMNNPADKVQLMTHSWGNGFFGCPTPGEYDSDARFIDQLVNAHPELSVQWAIGNTQTSGCVAGNFRSVTSGWEISKNSIGVGSLDADETMSGYSSFGPIEDGRIKPDICGIGTSVYSTTPNDNYQNMSGTSMSTPGVSGTLALVYEYYRDNIGGGTTYPNSQLVKAVALNNAQDLGNTGPDYKHGYGLINAYQTVKALEENRYLENTVANGATQTHNITVPAGTAELRVMITWLDPTAALSANPALINNLDLTVTDPSSTNHNPYILDPNSPATPATTGVDNLNNVEQVVLTNPAAGTYTLNVAGTNVPSGPQTYALTWTVHQPQITVTYPIGGETLDPNSNYSITWDAAGVTGNQTVEYSLDNGGSWTTISNSVPASARRLAWTTPNTTSNQCLVRVSSGAITDQSDANFHIMNRASNMNAVAACGSANLTWNAATGAASYDVYKLDLTTGQYVFEANTAATNYNITGLSLGLNWFTVRAVSATGARSERADGVSANITAATDDLELVAVENPTCSFAVPSTPSVTIRIQNNSCGAMAAGTNIPVSYTFGGTTVNETFTLGASLAQGASTTYTFTGTLNITAAGTYTLDAAVSLGTDANATNNQITGYSFSSAPGLPYFEDFENPDPATCWTRTQDAGADGFQYGTALGSGSYAIPAGTQYAASNDDACNCDSDSDFLISPRFDFTGNTTVTLTFDAVYPATDWGSNAFVKVSTTGPAGPWTTEYTFDADATAGPTVNTGVDNTWQNITVDLSAYNANNQVWVAFHHDDDTGWGTGLAVDNFRLCGSAPTTASSYSPANAATGVATNTNLSVTFSGQIQAGAGNITITDGVTPLNIPVGDPQVSISGNTLTINPTATLNAGATYQVSYPAGTVQDICGNALPALTTGNWSFTTVSTFDSDSRAEAPATQVAAGTLSSLSTTSAAAMDVFRFDLRDLGTSDGLATEVTQIRIQQGAGNTVANWTTHIQGAELWQGGTQVTATSAVNANNINFTITPGNLDIADGASTTLTLKVFFTNTGNLQDGANFQFEIPATAHNLTASNSGSRFATTFPAAVTSNLQTVEVVATQIIFATVPTTVNNGQNFTVVAHAVDANGNIDTAPRNITLSLNSGPSTLTAGGAGLGPVAMTNGVYTWNSAQLDADGAHVLELSDGTLNVLSPTVNVITPTGGGGGSYTPPVVVLGPEVIYAIGQSESQVLLHWQDRASNEDGYMIYSQAGNGNTGWNLIGIVPAGSGLMTFMHDNLLPDTQYHYYVVAFKGNIYSPHSDQAEDYTFPEMPSFVSSTPACYNGTGMATVAGTHASGNFLWYTDSVGGEPILAANGATFQEATYTASAMTDSLTLYVTAKGYRYESASRLPVRIGLKPLPTAEILGDIDRLSCDATMTLEASDAGAGASYHWYLNDYALVQTTTTPQAQVSRNGKYTLIVERDGCRKKAAESVQITLNFAPEARILQGTQATFCQNGTLQAEPNNNASFEWERNGTSLGTGTSLDVTESGLYTLRVTENGCMKEAQIQVTVSELPTDLSIATSDDLLCQGEGFTLTTDNVAGATYRWFRNGNYLTSTSSPSYASEAAGTWRVEAEVATGCAIASSEVTVSVAETPKVSLVQEGADFVVRVQNNANFSSLTWFIDGVEQPALANQTQVTPTTEGRYSIAATFPSGCEAASKTLVYRITGLEDQPTIEGMETTIFPNPTTDKLNVQLPEITGKVTLEVVDNLGRSLLRKTQEVSGAATLTLDVKGLPAGAYLLKVQHEQLGESLHKIVKE